MNQYFVNNFDNDFKIAFLMFILHDLILLIYLVTMSMID